MKAGSPPDRDRTWPRWATLSVSGRYSSADPVALMTGRCPAPEHSARRRLGPEPETPRVVEAPPPRLLLHVSSRHRADRGEMGRRTRREQLARRATPPIVRGRSRRIEMTPQKGLWRSRPTWLQRTEDRAHGLDAPARFACSWGRRTGYLKSRASARISALTRSCSVPARATSASTSSLRLLAIM